VQLLKVPAANVVTREALERKAEPPVASLYPPQMQTAIQAAVRRAILGHNLPQGQGLPRPDIPASPHDRCLSLRGASLESWGGGAGGSWAGSFPVPCEQKQGRGS
jgi:hypothetical protein